MNPQLGQKLTVLEASPPLLCEISFMNSKYEKAWKNDIVKAITSMDGTVQGRQILLFYKVKKIVLYKEEYIESMDKLYEEYNSLKSGK